MSEKTTTAVCEPIQPTALRDALGVKWSRELDPLRKSLLSPRPAPRRQLREVAPTEAAEPTPGEVVSGAPAARRLCEAHHRACGELQRRGRRQRVGLAMFVSTVSLCAGTLLSEQGLAFTKLQFIVVSPAMLAFAGIAVLAALGMRDCRRLSVVQGERMLRGIDFGCTLPPPRVRAYLAAYPTATLAFLACYRAWLRLSRPRPAWGTWASR